MEQTDITLYAYSGESLPVVGCAKVKVEYQSQVDTLIIYVIEDNGPRVFGR